MKSKSTNSQFGWDDFDTEAYYGQYRSGILWDDCCLARMTIGALLELGVPLRSQVIGVDACNGGVIRGPSMLAPFMRDDGVLYWSDYGKPQLDHAKKIIASGKKGNLGDWAVHQTHMGECHPAWSGAALRACQLGKVTQQSIFELPENAYDIAITCFGPESLTGDRAEWKRAVTRFFRSVKPGHAVVMLYMGKSTGYSSAGGSFPAVPISQDDVLSIANKQLEKIQAFYIPSTDHGIRPEGEQFSYDGMGGIVGLKRTT